MSDPPGLRLLGRGVRRLLAGFSLAQEPRQLRGERFAGRQVLLVVDQLGALLELCDVRRRLLVGCDRLADLLGIPLGRVVELGASDT